MNSSRYSLTLRPLRQLHSGPRGATLGVLEETQKEVRRLLRSDTPGSSELADSHGVLSWPQSPQHFVTDHASDSPGHSPHSTLLLTTPVTLLDTVPTALCH
ncbi:hypothetical protein ACOMHN_031234 [Nucella lapillus]